MIKKNDQVYYAVGFGREIGIYNSWKDCRAQVDNFSDAKFKKFFTLKEAEEFVNNCRDRSLAKNKSDLREIVNSNDYEDSESGTNLMEKQEESLKNFDTVKFVGGQEQQSHIWSSSTRSVISSLVPTSPPKMSQELVNGDVLAINLRLDSFEKRFDACLKEVGGILSEINHIRNEIKEIKESINFSSVNLNSSRKKAGMLQAKLNFSKRNCENESTFSFQNPSSSRFYSNLSDSDRDEPLPKKARSTKKNEFTSNFTESEREIDVVVGNDFNFDEQMKAGNFTVDSENFVHVYTDGACQANGQKGAKAGIGIWFGDCHPLNISEAVKGAQTNNSAEIQAARVAIELAIKAGVKKLKIFTDSEFLINCATKWIHRWKKNDWTLVDGGQVKNRKELEKLDRLASEINVRWEKVEGHSGVKGNEMADRLAKEGINKCQR